MEEEVFDIMTDEETTDAELKQHQQHANNSSQEEHHDVIHPDMQQFESGTQQFQQFRRKSIIPVDETVSILNIVYAAQVEKLTCMLE